MNNSVNYSEKTVKSLTAENHNVESSSVFENHYLFYHHILLDYCNHFSYLDCFNNYSEYLSTSCC